MPAELLEGTSLIGPEGFVAERLAALKESGVTTLNVTPLAPRTPTGSRSSRRSATWPGRGAPNRPPTPRRPNPGRPSACRPERPGAPRAAQSRAAKSSPTSPPEPHQPR